MTKKSVGNFILVLHTHLPYVLHHGQWPHGMEWLYEAASETYIPLLNALNALQNEGRRPRLTISMTPVITEQLASEAFKKEFVAFLYDEIDRARTDMVSFEKSPTEKKLVPLAEYWLDFYQNTLKDFTLTYRHDLIGAFRTLQDQGVLDIITCGATHGYFPLLGTDANIHAQIRMAVVTHEKYFGRKPRGIWLPECAYRPRYVWTPPVASALGSEPRLRKGIEEILDANSLEYFIVDSSLVEPGRAVPMYMGRFENLRKLMMRLASENRPIPKADFLQSVYDVYKTKSSYDAPGNPVSIFARDMETSMQVWSSEQGYPGGEWYLDFHKKHEQSGHRYWRVTSLEADLGLKAPYEPQKIQSAIADDAQHFVQAVRQALTRFKTKHGYEGTLTAPFDSELFGHWWFEGPGFLKTIFELMDDDPAIQTMHCAESLDQNPPEKIIAIPEGSWGAGGNHYVWFNHEVDWMWPFIYNDEAAMRDHVQRWNNNTDPEWTAIIKQMARELFLLESSDWPFLISTQSAIDYATERFMEHHTAFEKLARLSEYHCNGSALHPDDRAWLREITSQDHIFDDALIDPNWFLND